MRHLTVVSLLGLASSACISTITPPEPTAQAKVSYGPKIFLRDATFGEPTVGRPCVLLGKVAHVATGTSATATSTTIGGELLVLRAQRVILGEHVLQQLGHVLLLTQGLLLFRRNGGHLITLLVPQIEQHHVADQQQYHEGEQQRVGAVLRGGCHLVHVA